MQLTTRQIDGAQPGPHLLITAGVHGDEFEGMAAVGTLIHRLDAAQLRGRLTLVPVVNEAAYLRGERTAEDGLDLARTCPGQPEGSITEQIAFALSALIRAADYYIDLHSGGRTMRALPLAGYTLHPDPRVLESQRRMARAFNLPVVWGTYPWLDGRTLSVARDAGVPAIYAEYQGAGQCDPAGVDAYVAGCVNVMAALEMIDRPTPASRIEVALEDPRENSGYLQICHPSPCTGLFEPAVALGQHVRRGERFGTVRNLLTDSAQAVACSHDGMVLVLRSFPRVIEGEGLGVILETEREDAS